jgi:hypothetical protein
VDLTNVFPSKYLKVSDVAGGQQTVIMSSVRMEQMQQTGQKPVLYFQGMEKGLVLNQTNLKAIAGRYTHHSDKWVGQPIVLFTTWETIQGSQMEVLRCRPPSDRDLPGRGTTTFQSGPQGGAQGADRSDDIPF